MEQRSLLLHQPGAALLLLTNLRNQIDVERVELDAATRTRPVVSAAIEVEPEPRNGSMTMSLRLVRSRRAAYRDARLTAATFCTGARLPTPNGHPLQQLVLGAASPKCRWNRIAIRGIKPKGRLSSRPFALSGE